MGQYINKFEEAIDNVPYSTNWVEMANNVLATICYQYHDDCSYFQTMQSIPIQNGGYFRTIVFEIYGQIYLYNDAVKDNSMQCSQLERIIEMNNEWTNIVSLVLYSSDPTAQALAQDVLNVYKTTKIKRDWVPSLNKG